MIRIFTFSPDGAVVVLLRSNLGSQSLIVFLINFESIIGSVLIKVDIFSLFSSPSIEITNFSNLLVTIGTVTHSGYKSGNSDNSLVSWIVKSRHTTLTPVFGRLNSNKPFSLGFILVFSIFNSSKAILVSKSLPVFGSFKTKL